MPHTMAGVCISARGHPMGHVCTLGGGGKRGEEEGAKATACSGAQGCLMVKHASTPQGPRAPFESRVSS